MFALQKPERVTGRLLVIIGPTAIGKTALSLKLARQFNGHIVSADSRLFYRGMNIGTAKPEADELAQAPHHLIDICKPDETLSLGAYQDMAFATIDKIVAGGALPIVVGGTGQYVKSLVEGWGIPRVSPQTDLRASLDKLDTDELGRWLTLLDPVAADRLDFRNRRRVIRALEVILVAGQPISVLQKKSPPPYDIKIIGLTTEREHLYQRIDERVDRMMAGGFESEVRQLQLAGFGAKLPAMSALGYRQIFAYLAGEMRLAEAVERIKFDTHSFVRSQYNWFQLADPAITWFDIRSAEYPDKLTERLAHWIDEE
eukprot:jgi/Undpi1/12095/HiC_scaffold_40.g14068.m1